MAAILEVKGLSAWYGQIRALYEIDLSIEQGGVTALLGANGAGKTTTLRAICNMVRRSGTTTLDGRDISRLSTEDIVRLGIGQVPEGRGTFTGLTVEENLAARVPYPQGPRRRAARHGPGVRTVSPPEGTAFASRPARCPAASSRCSPSAAR